MYGYELKWDRVWGPNRKDGDGAEARHSVKDKVQDKVIAEQVKSDNGW